MQQLMIEIRENLRVESDEALLLDDSKFVQANSENHNENLTMQHVEYNRFEIAV